jgi:uncharacterized protein (DUF4415 family)
MAGDDSVQDRLRTLTQEIANTKLMVALEDLKREMDDIALRQETIPAEWRELEKTAPTHARRKKVTLSLDEDVARWFHKLGAGYHRRINAVLRAYMLAVVSKHILGAGDRNRLGDEIWGKAAPKRKSALDEMK